jgi:hypothetical protein
MKRILLTAAVAFAFLCTSVIVPVSAEAATKKNGRSMAACPAPKAKTKRTVRRTTRKSTMRCVRVCRPVRSKRVTRRVQRRAPVVPTETLPMCPPLTAPAM